MILAKIRTDSVRLYFYNTPWPTQPWFPAMLHLLAERHIILPQSGDLSFLPSSSRKHPLLPQLRLMACLLSGIASERRAFQMRQSILSCQPGDHLQRHQYLSSIRQWCKFCITKQIPSMQSICNVRIEFFSLYITPMPITVQWGQPGLLYLFCYPKMNLVFFQRKFMKGV